MTSTVQRVEFVKWTYKDKSHYIPAEWWEEFKDLEPDEIAEALKIKWDSVVSTTRPKYIPVFD